MAVLERTFSHFLTRPSEITPDLAEGPVVLTRRSEEDVVVMTKGQLETIETALRVLNAATQGAAKTELPWLPYLSTTDQEACVQEIASAAAGAMHRGQLARLKDTIYAWEATGLAAWDDHNRRGDQRYAVAEPVPVGRPTVVRNRSL